MVGCIILIEIFILDNGGIINLMVKVTIILLMVGNIRVNGKMIRDMDMENRFGMMGLSSRDHINLIKNMVMVYFIILMEINIKAVLDIIKNQVEVL